MLKGAAQHALALVCARSLLVATGLNPAKISNCHTQSITHRRQSRPPRCDGCFNSRHTATYAPPHIHPRHPYCPPLACYVALVTTNVPFLSPEDRTAELPVQHGKRQDTHDKNIQYYLWGTAFRLPLKKATDSRSTLHEKP